MSSIEAQVSCGEISLRAGDSAADELRDTYVRNHPRATFFHLAGWRRVVERVHGHAPHDLYAWDADRLVGVLPLMLCRGLVRPRVLLSMPYATYGGPIADDPAIEKQLVDRARALAQELGVSYLELRCIEDIGLDLVTSDLYCTFRRELSSRRRTARNVLE